MNPEHDDRLLEDSIRRAVRCEDVRFDAAGWMSKHPEEVSILRSRKSNIATTGIRKWHTWRMMMSTRSMKAAVVAAGAAIIAVALVVLCSGGGSSVAYALEQTVEASRQVRNYHIRITPAAGQLGELWAQMDENGKVIQMRAEFPEPPSGPKTTFWSEGKARVWFKDKHTFLVVSEPNILKPFKDLHATVDPRLAFEKIEKARQEGTTDVKTVEPTEKGQPITVTVTAKASPNRHDVYLVNPGTKLIESCSVYLRKAPDNGWEKVSTTEYQDYNQPIDPSVWEPELPNDVETIDQTTQAIGLAKGELSDNEMAVKVAREFFEAMIAKDYKQASQIFEGLPTSKLKEVFGEITFLRIVEIGTPRPDPETGTNFIQVPVKVEVEQDGKTFVKEFTPGIRAAYNQPSRWVISGGDFAK